MSVTPAAETDTKSAPVGGVGLDTTCQNEPSHCSVSDPLAVDPTAQTSLVPSATAASNRSPLPPLGAGAPTNAQLAPFQCRASGISPPL